MIDNSIPAAEQGVAPALSQIQTANTTVQACRFPGRRSCCGCEYSFAPDLFDGGCLAGYSEEERRAIRNNNPMPVRRV